MRRMRLPRQSPACPVHSLYKALTKKKTKTNETCCMKPITLSRFGLCGTSSVFFFLTEKRSRTITESQQSRTQCAAPATAEGPTAVRKCDHEERGMHVPTPTAFIQTTQQGFGRTRDALPSQMNTSLLFFVEFTRNSWSPPSSQPATNQTSRCRGENWCRFPEAPQGDCPHQHPSLVWPLLTPQV